LSIQAYKFVTLFCISAHFKLLIYLHTYYVSHAGCLEAFDQAVKTHKQTRVIRSSRLAERYNAPLCTLPLEPTSRLGIATKTETHAICCYTGLDTQYIVNK